MAGKRKLILGIFIIGGVVLFCFGLFLIGSRKQLFSHHFTVYTEMPSMQTLQSGATVRVAGMDAGQVTGIEIPKNPSSKFRLTLEVDEKFHAIVRTDSSTSIETAGMVGSKYIEIAQGSANSPECPPFATLPNKQSPSMSDLMREGTEIAGDVKSTITDLHKNADETLQSFTATAKHVDRIVTSVRGNVDQIASNAAHITADARQIAAGVQQGKGVAGELLTDPKVAANVRQTIANARQTSESAEQASNHVDAMIKDIQQKDLPEVHKTLSNTSHMTGQLDQATGTFLSKGNHDVDTAVALRNTVQGAQQAVTNLSDDTSAIKHNFFLRGFFHRRGFFDLTELTPSKYAGSKFVRQAHARVWIPASGLFATQPDGSQELTATGRSILNQSMSDLVPFLPNNPIMIEGYAESGIPDQQYVASRQRAYQVRQYLLKQFHLKAEYVGMMPLANHPPPGTGKSSWDGVCLALVVSK